MNVHLDLHLTHVPQEHSHLPVHVQMRVHPVCARMNVHPVLHLHDISGTI